MSEPKGEGAALLDDLLRDARALEIEAGRDDDALVAQVTLAGRARHVAHRRRSVALVVGGCLAACAAVALFVVGPAAVPSRPASAIVELTLPTSDRLAATGDARFDVTSSAQALRIVRLRRGAMLFDVAPLGDGSRFEVETPDARVLVRGTVFSVEVFEGGTAVHVYEGVVELVRRGAAPLVLEAGASDGVPRGGSAHLAQLDARGRAAAAMRVYGLTAPRVEQVVVAEAPSAPAQLGEGEPIAHRRRSPSPSRAVDPEPAVLAPLPVEARRLLASGQPEDALHMASPRAVVDPEWRVIEADALRALGRSAEAADAYEDAAHRLGGVASSAAAFLAAELRMRRLDDPAGALRVLDDTGTDAVGSPLRERGLALRADALERLGRTAELREVATTYLDERPTGPRATSMRAHLSDQGRSE